MLDYQRHRSEMVEAHSRNACFVAVTHGLPSISAMRQGLGEEGEAEWRNVRRR